MLTCMQGISELRQLRLELQEDAGDDFPHALGRELLLLYDVCKALGLTIFQCKEVLGEAGWCHVKRYINQPISKTLPSLETFSQS